ncbi:hypothetical protein FS837_004537 [Tulasnella sp. UAMH 9824]|nr:hypothetical protein FS837_004537 [Tulasnella sp. UAMH 9824]
MERLPSRIARPQLPTTICHPRTYEERDVPPPPPLGSERGPRLGDVRAWKPMSPMSRPPRSRGRRGQALQADADAPTGDLKHFQSANAWRQSSISALVAALDTRISESDHPNKWSTTAVYEEPINRLQQTYPTGQKSFGPRPSTHYVPNFSRSLSPGITREASAQAPRIDGGRESIVEDTVSLARDKAISAPPPIDLRAGESQSARLAQPPSEPKSNSQGRLLLRGGISRPSPEHYIQPGSALATAIDDVAELPWVEFSTVVEGERGRYRQRGRNAVAYGGFSDVFLCDARLANGSSALVAVKRLRAVKIAGQPDSCTIDQKLQKASINI